MTCHINLIGIGNMNAAPSKIHANDLRNEKER